MGKKKKKKSFEKTKRLPRFALPDFALPEETKKWIFGIITFIIAIIIALSFFGSAGVAGKVIMAGLVFLIGKAVFIIPLVLALGGLVFFSTKYQKFILPAILAIIVLTIGISGILEVFNHETRQGGFLGFIFTWPFLKLFGPLVTKIVFGGVILVGVLIFWQLLRGPKQKEMPGLEKKSSEDLFSANQKPSLIKKFFSPQFKVKEVEPRIQETPLRSSEISLELKSKPITKIPVEGEYKLPPLDLLESDKGKAAAGDTITNSAIIKKTLENFGLGVEMSEINIGPTVTQYSLKPAEGIKLSKITALSNNLSLALASHPIRIEAPIPGKSLVGIEMPNKQRCQVRLRDLIANPNFQKSPSNLLLVLGKDVSGNPCYADLARMPHLLVAGSTGTGKTIFLNNILASLLYQSSPDILRLILIDPKRVEFTAYKDLPHLLAPVIFDAHKTVNALKWLTSEMERRFEVLSQNGSRDIASYNRKVADDETEESLPYIVVVIDELADLMAAKGREVEAGIVRLAQMARAVGIHLIVATQRPSVEVITGLIKANITSRVTFQVASQVDSRTVLDTAGAEKLLGAGDLLFVSAEVVKPKRIQAAYVSEKEVGKIVSWVKGQKDKIKTEKLKEEIFENHLAQELTLSLEKPEGEDSNFADDDSLYEEAKKIVIESRKASASLLQRRLKLGYARAARLIDMLEERGVVGPGDGAKPREILFGIQGEEENEDDGWQKV